MIFESESCQFFGSEVGYLGGTKSFSLAKAGSEESGLPSQPGTRTAPEHVVRYLRDWKVYHFHDTSETAKVKQPGNIRDAARLRPDASNLAAFLYFVRYGRKSPAYEKIVSTIQRVAPFFHDFVLEPEPDNANSIRLRWKHRGTDAYFDASDLSDGTLRFICMATLLLQPELPTIILLDEPELGLHPYAIQLLASIMRSTASETQIIASTQSVTLANQLDHQDLIVVDRVEEASRFRRLSDDEVKPWLDEYGVGDLWEKNLIGGTP